MNTRNEWLAWDDQRANVIRFETLRKGKLIVADQPPPWPRDRRPYAEGCVLTHRGLRWTNNIRFCWFTNSILSERSNNWHDLFKTVIYKCFRKLSKFITSFSVHLTERMHWEGESNISWYLFLKKKKGLIKGLYRYNLSIPCAYCIHHCLRKERLVEQVSGHFTQWHKSTALYLGL